MNRLRIKKGIKKLVKRNKHIHQIAVKAKRIVRPSKPIKIEVYDFKKQYPSDEALSKQRLLSKDFNIRPKISILIPTYNTNEKFLKECIESVINQSYGNWELCIADDASPDKTVVKTIKKYIKLDPRIKLDERDKNGHISLATNSAAKLATGEFLALLDHDDILWPNALHELVKAINEQPGIDFIYTDEDKIDEFNTIHSYPFFKPDWSPEFLESCNYITHFSCVRATIFNKIGGFRKGYEGAQDWDLIIRIADVTQKIHHIPKVLYSWRVHEESTAQDTDAKPYVFEAQRNLLKDHIVRKNKKGEVKTGIIWQHSVIKYEVPGNPKVSVVLYGQGEAYKKSLKISGYNNLEIIEVDNEEITNSLNKAVTTVNGEFVVFLPRHSEITSKNWISILLGDVQISGVGIVGGRKITKDREKLVSAGVGIGINGTFSDLLKGDLIDDNHYMRALHGKSRRNVSAIEPPLIVRTQLLKGADNFNARSKDFLFIDLCLRALDSGYRVVYNPYVDVIASIEIEGSKLPTQSQKEFTKRWGKYVEYDPYLNPNYNKTNGRLEVK